MKWHDVSTNRVVVSRKTHHPHHHAGQVKTDCVVRGCTQQVWNVHNVHLPKQGMTSPSSWGKPLNPWGKNNPNWNSSTTSVISMLSQRILCNVTEKMPTENQNSPLRLTQFVQLGKYFDIVRVTFSSLIFICKVRG